MKKDGQVSIFVILGIIILTIGFLSFYIRQPKSQETEVISEAPLLLNPVKNYIELCLEEIGKDAVVWIGDRGGYYMLPELSTRYFVPNTAIYYYKSTNIMPSQEVVESEIARYINENLNDCIRDFLVFKEQGFTIEQGQIKSATTLRESDVLLRLSFPLVIRIQDDSYEIKEFIAQVKNVRLKIIYDVIREIIEKQIETPDTICLSCIADLAKNNDLVVEMNSIENSTIIFTITDLNSEINNLPYKYIFANKYEEYSCSNLPIDASEDLLLECLQLQIEEFNYILKIEEILDLNAIVNIPFVYNVNAIGANINFSDFTNLFEINKTTGLIKFTPKEDQIGIYTVWIRVKDSLGNENYESFQLNIINSS